MIRTFEALRRVEPGFSHAESVLTLRVSIPEATAKQPERAVHMFNDIQSKLATTPGVKSVAIIDALTMGGNTNGDALFAEDHPLAEGKLPPIRRFKFIAPGFFQTMGRPFLAGRDLSWSEVYGVRPVVIISENLAREYWGRPAAALGKRVRESAKDEWREIIGVVADMHLISLRLPPKPQIYLPHHQFAIQTMSIFVRTQMDPQSLIGTLRRTVGEIDKDVPVYRVRALPEYVSESVAQPRLNAMLVGLFALISLLLAAAGIFGVMSYSVTQRTQEIGIRLALGAQRYDVLRLIIVQGMRVVGLGLVLGLIGVFVCTRLLQSLLFGIGATDLTTMLSVTLILTAVAFVACLLPARRASLVDPIEALRAE